MSHDRGRKKLKFKLFYVTRKKSRTQGWAISEIGCPSGKTEIIMPEVVRNYASFGILEEVCGIMQKVRNYATHKATVK